MPVGAILRISGRVQGVGFRPTVHRLAKRAGLAGDVCNTTSGVVVRLFGSEEAISRFAGDLHADLPPLASIRKITHEPWIFTAPPSDFLIVESDANGRVTAGLVPDAATCPACLSDIYDPANRRYRYPFTNCTHCGPRFSIVESVPFDRTRTTMGRFDMCAACQAEYDDPSDRRHHAQANACPDCGPRVWLEDGTGRRVSVSDAIVEAAARITNGEIVAIKGLGGFHLACSATRFETVRRLRDRKRRVGKPFALMASDVETVRRFVDMTEAERVMLEDASAPIVLLPASGGASELADDIAPGQDHLGFMLPYTPLHHLLMAELDDPIVLTSGNTSDEPQVIDNDAARTALPDLADACLMHDRDIAVRVDDSVVIMEQGTPSVIRRGRGWAPDTLPLPPGFGFDGCLLAMGASLKSTFTLARSDGLLVSHHVGDLGDAATFADYRCAIDRYLHLFDTTPDQIVVDLHPDYASTRWGERLAERYAIPATAVQHHHAHIAACLAEHDQHIDAPAVLGVVLDGTGLGDDETSWGAEFMRADYRSYQRLASFQPMPLIGGDRAAREPWRNAFAWLDGLFGFEAAEARWPDLPVMRQLRGRRPDLLHRMVRQQVNAPYAVSAGRLFDAVAAVIGLAPDTQSYEGEAAIALEVLSRRGGSGVATYPVTMAEGAPAKLEFGDFFVALLDDLAAGTDAAIVASRFHASLAVAIATTASGLAAEHSLKTVVLSGGVFQNRTLLEHVRARLAGAGLQVLVPSAYPANDGGVSLGQAAIAMARHLRRNSVLS